MFDRTVRAETFSIGIDPDEIARAAESEEGRAAAARLGRLTEHRALVIGVDRMDYSKGLPQRMEAFGRMLDEHEEMRGKVSFLQIAPPSREAVDAYQVLREELDRLSGRINGDYADLDWMPIRYLARSYSRDVLAGLFRLSRAGLVTPLYDGMNLVAKEFVAAQTADDPGVLVLSEFAGAADQMQAALLVNPHDIAATAYAIHRALTMPQEERHERWQDLDALGPRAGYRLVAPQLPRSARRHGGPGVSLGGLEGLRLGSADGLFLDLDGTLAEIVADPDAVQLPADTAAALVRLARRFGGALAVLSGRDVRDLARRTPADVWRIGGHGLEVLPPGADPPPAAPAAA